MLFQQRKALFNGQFGANENYSSIFLSIDCKLFFFVLLCPNIFIVLDRPVLWSITFTFCYPYNLCTTFIVFRILTVVMDFDDGGYADATSTDVEMKDDVGISKELEVQSSRLEQLITAPCIQAFPVVDDQGKRNWNENRIAIDTAWSALQQPRDHDKIDLEVYVSKICVRAEGESVHAQPAGESPSGAAACSGKVADDPEAPPVTIEGRCSSFVVNPLMLSTEQRARLWHWRLAHPSHEVPVKLTRSGQTKGLEVTLNLNEDCPICDKAKFRFTLFKNTLCIIYLFIQRTITPHCSKSFLYKNSTNISRENCRFFGVKNSRKSCGFGLFSC